MADGEQVFESTGTTSKDLAIKIWRKPRNEVASGKFKLDWPGEWIAFEEMCKEHLACRGTIRPRVFKSRILFK
jgi:hypothetical protein